MERLLVKLEHESLREFYFLTISLILAFGILQTSGTFLQTDKPVVSVVSCSMYPSLNVGDVLLVKGENYEEIEQEEIVVYSIKEATITVNGEENILKDYDGGKQLDTAAGKIKLLRILEGPSGDPAGARVSLNDQIYTIAEGEALQANGATLELKEARGMNIPVVHRVIEKNKDYLETKGDNNQRQLEFEDRVEPEQIHGTMWFKIPRVGGIKLLVMDLIGFSGDAPLRIDSYPKCTVQT